METVSQRLEETTTRLEDVANGLQTNIAVHEERLKNQDKVIEEIRQAAKEHQQSDLNAHALMNEKLDGISSKLDVMKGAADATKTESTPPVDSITPSTIFDKIGTAVDRWKYWFYGGVFMAGALLHKANLFDYIEKIFTGHS